MRYVKHLPSQLQLNHLCTEILNPQTSILQYRSHFLSAYLNSNCFKWLWETLDKPIFLETQVMRNLHQYL